MTYISNAHTHHLAILLTVFSTIYCITVQHLRLSFVIIKRVHMYTTLTWVSRLQVSETAINPFSILAKRSRHRRRWQWPWLYVLRGSSPSVVNWAVCAAERRRECPSACTHAAAHPLPAWCVPVVLHRNIRICTYRVRTEIWLRFSRLFQDKITSFSRLFEARCSSLCQHKHYEIGF